MRLHARFWLGAALTAFWLLAWAASYAIVSYRALTPTTDWAASLWCGEFFITTGGTYFSPGFDVLYSYPRPDRVSSTCWWPANGWFRSIPVGPSPMWEVHIPLWAPLLLSAAFWASAIPAWRRARRAARTNTCPTCGYDTHGITGPCPECGRRTLPA